MATTLNTYRAVAWWNTQRGADINIEAASPEDALQQLKTLIEEGDDFISLNREYDDSDGPTNLEVWSLKGDCMDEPVAADPSDELRFSDARVELLETIDNVTAALETCLAHYGDQMPNADRLQRKKLAFDARALLDGLRPATVHGEG